MKRTTLILASLTLLNLGACVLPDKQIGEDEGATESGDGDGDGDGDGEPFDECAGPFGTPAADQDCDGVGIACDNAKGHHNPDQRDQDEDGLGDVADVCPLIALPGDRESHGDADKDGVGNHCDHCAQAQQYYNDVFPAIEDPRLWVRNIPLGGDHDRDGVGDACDNCVAFANCHDYGPDNPAAHGAGADDGDSEACQADSDNDGIGDACIDPDTFAPYNLEFAAGPVGFGGADDFDQDGINNLEDACPRLPVARVDLEVDERTPCNSDGDCEASASCALTPANDGQRYCNHVDTDADSVGDVCDTCPYSPNPMQVTEVGMELDDEDGDFIGSTCESCNDRKDPRPIAFYDAAAQNLCCVTIYPGDDVLHDPDGVPIRIECSDADQAQDVCRRLPASVAATPGVVSLPPGCAGEATELTLDDVGGDASALWANACYLPPLDQDFDGVQDACDLCRFGHDPTNEPYTDGEGTLWPDTGAACNGDYGPDQVPGAACEPG